MRRHVLNPEVFEEAIDLLVDRGWLRNPKEEYPIDGPLCIWQAVFQARDLISPRHDLAGYEQAMMSQLKAVSVGAVWQLNDVQSQETGLAWACDNLHDLQVKAEAEYPLGRRVVRWIRQKFAFLIP